MLIIPAIDLRQGKCVRLAQGRKEAATAYAPDPISVAKAFEADAARMLHVIDLDGAFGEGQSLNRDVAKRIIHSVSVPVQFGGGLRTIVVGIDSRDGQVMTRGWEKHGQIEAVELARRIAGAGVERIVYTDVARDGMLTGPNIEQTCLIARESGLKVTASGGVSSLEDIERLRRVTEAGVDSVIVGKALYEGRFTLKEALQTAESR
jgi:phosphoribosylformimino-5-aminoimidazole carboxamide ribotide isomerase